MKITARRGVCIGVDRHLQAGDSADLDAAQVEFLVGIGAVEIVPDAPTESAAPPVEEPPVKKPEPATAPAKKK